MGMSTGGDRNGIKNEINVTPLVDIVLVLLIIFLVLTPVKMRYITLEVPRKLDEKVEDTTLASKQITVTVNAEDDIDIFDGNETLKITSMFDIAKTVGPLLEKKRTEKVVFVDFNDNLEYGMAVQAMDTIRGAGAEKVALKIRVEDEAQ